jgi:flagellar biosynthesis/type III secretory pathway M-ring protein FliF/YscJ
VKRPREKSLLVLVVVFLLVTVGIKLEVFTENRTPEALFPLRPTTGDREMYDHLRGEGYRVEMQHNALLIDPRQRTAALASLLSRGLPNDLDNVIQSSFSHHGERVGWQIPYLENLFSDVLEELSEVARAEVKMTIPQKTYFQDDTRKASCVVKVWTWSGEPLDSNVRSATPYLLNRFMEDFGPETVTVLENPAEQ